MNQFLVCLSNIFIFSFIWLLEICFIPKIISRYFKTFYKCPPVKNKILFLSAQELSNKIRKKEISCILVTKAYISRIEEVNSLLNAVIEDRFEEALKDAEKVDQLLETCKLTEKEIENKYPLLGVPITIKGSIAVSGMNHSSGRVDIDKQATEDAKIVKKVRNAGAIILLISNIPEMCLNWECVNKLVGTTKNPYDCRRTPGGSSGGEAALLSSGASLIGLGSDIACSLRLPAHYCGVWGHKPSPHVVSSVGHYPDCKNKKEWDKVFTLGPMTRYATDLRLLLDVIAETDMKNILKLDQSIDVKKVKVYFMKDPRSKFASNFQEDVLDAFDMAISHFNNISDCKCKKVKLPLMKYCAELSFLHMLLIKEVDGILKVKGKGIFKELLKSLLGKSKHEISSVNFEILQYLTPKIYGGSLKFINQRLEKLRSDFLEILGDDGVFILPTHLHEAPYTGDSPRKPFNIGGLSIFNSLGFPATSCPVKFSKNGLPIGVQVVSAPNCDHLNLCVAEELEKAFGGWQFS